MTHKKKEEKKKEHVLWEQSDEMVNCAVVTADVPEPL